MTTSILWDPDFATRALNGMYAGGPAADPQQFIYGRCRSGRRWFWTVAELGSITSHDQIPEHHGWADTEQGARRTPRGRS